MTAIVNDISPEALGRAALGGRSAGPEVVYGRAAEQKIVGDLLRRARRGAGGVVLVEGDPGSGKSMLLRVSSNEAAEQGFSLAAGAGGEIVWTRACLERRAEIAPVLVCLDDLHWASPAALAALRSLSRDLRRHPVAWLLARSSTPQGAADQLFGLLGKDGAARVTLDPLNEDAVAAMLADAFGVPPDQALADLADGAAGNPALVAELIGGLRDEDGVHVTGGRAVLASSRLPRRVHRFAQRRLGDLSKQARQLLVTGAVLGPTFRLEDAAEMLGQAPAGLLPAVEETVDAAIMTDAEYSFAFRHQLLRRAIGEITPRPARQALHRQYGEMLLARGESADRAARHLLRAAYPANRVSLASLDEAAERTLCSAPQIAADLTLRALELTPPVDPAVLSRAAAAAEALTAAGRLDQAARIARDMLARPLPSVIEDRLRCALSSILCAAGRPRDAVGQAQAVLARPQLSGALRDQAMTAQLQALAGLHDKLAGPAADTILATPREYDSRTTVAALVTRAVVSWDSGQVSDSLELLRHAAHHDTGISTDARHVQSLLALAAALTDLRQLGEAEDTLRAVDNLALPDIPARAALSLLRARIDLSAGRLADAASSAQAALAATRSLGAHGYASTAHCVLSAIELRRGDIAAAAQNFARRPAHGPQFADIYARAETAMAEAQVTEAHYGPLAALGHLRQLCADLEARPGLLLGDPAAAAWMARTALAAGEGEVAVSAASAAQSLADAHPGLPALAAAAAHSRGVAHGDAACLAQAIAQHPDVWASASAAEDLGVLHGRQGGQDQAIRHLREALDGYHQVGADRDQARIRRRLRKLGVRHRHWTALPARPVTGWDSLTETERAVASLVAEGLNNKQVADRMYISPHTVAHHLRQAFQKLSIASRVELTRIVIERAANNDRVAACGHVP